MSLNTRQKSKLKEIAKNYYDNHTIHKDAVKPIYEDIHKKSGLNISLEMVIDYISSFFHLNTKDDTITVKPDKRRTIRVIKKKIEIPEKKEESISSDTPEEKKIIIEAEEIPIDTEDLEKEFASLMTENNKVIIKNKEFEQQQYKFPLEIKYTIIKKTDPKFGPYGTQWINDEQVDDVIIDKLIKRRIDVFRKLANIKYPEQKSAEWHQMRDSKITASDVGCVVGDNKYEPSWRFLMKKIYKMPFKGNKNTYHGNKYEKIATMIYEYRMNVTVQDFGLLEHEKFRFLGASPDGIISEYKADGKHKTRFVGRMIEIKCPVTREIKITDVVEETCPSYYLCQVQQQLEVCDLDECDFWQCKIYEYKNREEFLKDTHPDEPFRSKTNEMEKGCLIQVMPKHLPVEFDKYNTEENNKKYQEAIWEYAKFIHPPRIEMTPYEYDQWVMETINKVNSGELFAGYTIDQVIYWRMDVTHCVTINRDREWFNDKFPLMLKAWEEVEFFRKNNEAKELLFEYIASVGLNLNVEDRKFNTKYFEKEIKSMINNIKTAFKSDEENKNLLINKIKETIKNNIETLNTGGIFEKIYKTHYPNRTYKGGKSKAKVEDSDNEIEEFNIIDD